MKTIVANDDENQLKKLFLAVLAHRFRKILTLGRNSTK